MAKAWREVGVAPWRVETFKFSTDPELVAKVTDVVGLYLAPPEDAIVRCTDEESQIQALERTAPMLPMQPGLPGPSPDTDTGTGTGSSCASSSRSPRPTPNAGCC